MNQTDIKMAVGSAVDSRRRTYARAKAISAIETIPALYDDRERKLWLARLIDECLHEYQQDLEAMVKRFEQGWKDALAHSPCPPILIERESIPPSPKEETDETH